jgi:hypothetical protein
MDILPFADDTGEKIPRANQSGQSVPLYCKHPRPLGYDPQTKKAIKFVPCGRAKCSRECRKRYGRMLAECLQRSFAVLPPTHHVRLTVQAILPDRELTKKLSDFLHKLRREIGSLQYLLVNEWVRGRRHSHIVIRTPAALSTPIIRRVWSRVCPIDANPHCGPVRCAAALARYVAKHLNDEEPELPPEDFTGRLHNSSRHFFRQASPGPLA